MQAPSTKKMYTSCNPNWAKLSEFEWVRPTQGDHFFSHMLFVSVFLCFLCPAKISVKYEGKNALEIHAKTKKHQVVLSNKRKQAAIATFMTKKAPPEEDKIAAAELSSACHGVKHGHSYLSEDCRTTNG